MLRDLNKPPARPSIVKDLARVNLSLLNTTSHYSVLNNQSSDSINTINSNLDTTGDLVSYQLQEEDEVGGLTKSDSAFTWQSKKFKKYFLVANSNSSFYSGWSLSHSVTSHFKG